LGRRGRLPHGVGTPCQGQGGIYRGQECPRHGGRGRAALFADRSVRATGNCELRIANCELRIEKM